MSDETITLDGHGAINWHGQPRVVAHRDPSMGDSIALRMAVDSQDGDRYIAQPAVFVKRDRGGLAQYTPPLVNLDMGTAQMLMDELWRCGLRPTEGSGSAGAMAAVEKHLDDMRSIAKQLLDDKLKGDA